MDEWYCFVDGRQVGPVTRQQVEAWVHEGRIAPTDFVWRPGMSEWAPLEDMPDFAGIVAGYATEARADQPPPPSDAPPPEYARWQRQAAYIQPHRGGTILALGVIALVVMVVFCCAAFIFGIPAWTMANRDLELMRQGVMDREGESLTEAGRICGMIASILSLAVVALFIVALCLGAWQPY